MKMRSYILYAIVCVLALAASSLDCLKLESFEERYFSGVDSYLTQSKGNNPSQLAMRAISFMNRSPEVRVAREDSNSITGTFVFGLSDLFKADCYSSRLLKVSELYRTLSVTSHTTLRRVILELFETLGSKCGEGYIRLATGNHLPPMLEMYRVIDAMAQAQVCKNKETKSLEWFRCIATQYEMPTIVYGRVLLQYLRTRSQDSTKDKSLKPVLDDKYGYRTKLFEKVSESLKTSINYELRGNQHEHIKPLVAWFTTSEEFPKSADMEFWKMAAIFRVAIDLKRLGDADALSEYVLDAFYEED